MGNIDTEAVRADWAEWHIVSPSPEDKELTTDLAYDRQLLSNQKQKQKLNDTSSF